MAAPDNNHDLKTRIRRLLRRSPLSSCSCKSIADDVVANWSSSSSSSSSSSNLLLPRRHSFSSSYEIDTPLLLATEVDGQKCPPSSPAVVPTHNKKLAKKKKQLQQQQQQQQHNNKKCLGFERLHNNGLFEHRLGGERGRAEEEEVAAVVKRSRDPYSDFRASMVEMIVEKQMFGAEDLECLLECFLTLNSRHHHKVIVQVFAEIWEALLL